jgi:hypothetical protein
VPTKRRNFKVLGSPEIPSNQAPSQVETPFPLTRAFAPVFGSFPRLVVHNPRRGHVFYTAFDESSAHVFRDGSGGLRRAALPCPGQIRPQPQSGGMVAARPRAHRRLSHGASPHRGRTHVVFELLRLWFPSEVPFPFCVPPSAGRDKSFSGIV